MKREVGLVVVNAVGQDNLSEVMKRLSAGQEVTPAGRNLILLWEAPKEWGKSLPIEGSATQLILGRPTDRVRSMWDLAGNGAVRLYPAGKNSPSRILQWVSFRLAGDRIYSRRNQLDEVTLSASRLKTSHPVFTRDVANNVWHLPLRHGIPTTIRRFQALLTWADESTILISSNTHRRLEHSALEMDSSLVPRAEKRPYSPPSPT